MTKALFVLWQFHNGRWSRATGPVPQTEANRMRDAAMASGSDVVYRVMPEHVIPHHAP